MKLLNFLSHEFLWTPTPAYYLGTFCIYLMIKSRFRLRPIHSIPMLAIPATADYYKRDHYVRMFQKEYNELRQSQKIVD